MQSATELINRVRGIVGDSSSIPRIFEHLNDGLAHIVRTVRPPDLQDFGNIRVPANERVASLPSDFFGPRIFEAKNMTSGELIKKIYYRNVEFTRDYPEIECGPIEALLIRGSQMFFSFIPQRDEDIQIKYLRKPTYFTSMDDDGSEITYLPDRLGERAVMFYAAVEEFRIIEDGVDGDKRNMADAKSAMLEVFAELVDYYGTENRENGGPVVAHDAFNLFGSFANLDTSSGRGGGL